MLRWARVRIYLDHNATAPPAPGVAEAVARAMTDTFGNASSVHAFGQRAKAALDDARIAVAALDRRRSQRSGVHQRRYRSRTTSRCVAQPTHSSRPGGAADHHQRDRARGGADDLPRARAAWLVGDDAAGRRAWRGRGRRRCRTPSTPRPRSSRSCTPTTRSEPFSRWRSSPPWRAPLERCSTPMRCSRSARFRCRCASSASICSRSRDTSSAGRRASARSGFVAAYGSRPS